MQVLKFGGSSVANATAISKVLDIVLEASKKDKVILVCSAISGATDLLIKAGESPLKERFTLLNDLKERHFRIIERLFTGVEQMATKQLVNQIYDSLLASPEADYPTFGEKFSTTIIAKKLAFEGAKALWLDSTDLIRCNAGTVDEEESYGKINSAINSHPEIDIYVAPGFIASDENGHVCTLGRGGSDFSAALFAAATKASPLQIWTDVPGIMTTNPKEVKAARTIPEISYDAAFSLASHGAKVLYAPTIAPARKKHLDIHILNTMDTSACGTVIRELPHQSNGEWIGLTHKVENDFDNMALVADGPVDRQSIEDIKAQLSKRDIDITDMRLEEDTVLLIDVPVSQGLDTLRTLHYYCFEKSDSRSIYLAGEGKVGQALIQIIKDTGNKIEIKAVSRHENEDEEFFNKLIREAEPDSIFVDCTDSSTIWKWYIPVLEAGVSIVSSNRRAFSVPYAQYAAMKRSARLNRCFLRYETTVGTALPILDSIGTSTCSADTITSIEAIVSCTLNYILTSGLPFKDALLQAQKAGLTEKDPSQDLLGRDATRKLLILAREAGVKLEEKDIEIEPVDPDKVKTGQRFVASLTKDDSSPIGYKAEIKLRTLSADHPAVGLKGTDNMIIIRSVYQPSPLIIQGSGEGEKMAAAGVLNDILR